MNAAISRRVRSRATERIVPRTALAITAMIATDPKTTHMNPRLLSSSSKPASARFASPTLLGEHPPPFREFYRPRADLRTNYSPASNGTVRDRMTTHRPYPDPRAPLSDEEWALVAQIVDLYAAGWFPMGQHARDRREPQWVQPPMRCLIPLEAGKFHLPGTLAAGVRSGRFEVTTDVAFERVIDECARPEPARARAQTWISPPIRDAFLLLHHAGHAHSVEAWLTQPAGPPVLVGGLYGLAVGRTFSGESMFSRPALGGRDASKVCLVHLVHHLRRRGFEMLDAQMENPHLRQFGAVLVPAAEYQARLRRAAQTPRPWTPFEPDRTIAELRTRA